MADTDNEEQANLSITRTHSGESGDHITIELKQGGLRKRLKIKLRVEDFGYAITGRSEVPCEIELDKFTGIQ